MEYFDPDFNMSLAEEDIAGFVDSCEEKTECIPDFIRECINGLSSTLNTFMPNYFAIPENIPAKDQSDYVETCFKMKKQVMAKEIVPMLNVRLKLNLLYVLRSHDHKNYRCVGFSSPSQDGCYIYYIDSHIFGIVEDMNVAFYKDTMTMFNKLSQSLFVLEKSSYKRDFDILEKISEQGLWSSFFA